MRKIALLCILFILFAFALPALAQTVDPTPEATVEIPPDAPIVGNVESGGSVSVTVNEGPVIDDTTEHADPPATLDLGAVYSLVAAVLLVMVGGGSFGFVLHRLSRDKNAIDSTEKLYESLSPRWQDTILRAVQVAEQAVQAANDAVQFAKMATDKQPNTIPSEERPAPTLSDYATNSGTISRPMKRED